MNERLLNGYWFRPVGDGDVEIHTRILGKRTLLKTINIKAETQKEFDSEISWWLMENASELQSLADEAGSLP